MNQDAVEAVARPTREMADHELFTRSYTPNPSSTTSSSSAEAQTNLSETSSFSSADHLPMDHKQIDATAEEPRYVDCKQPHHEDTHDLDELERAEATPRAALDADPLSPRQQQMRRTSGRRPLSIISNSSLNSDLSPPSDTRSPDPFSPSRHRRHRSVIGASVDYRSQYPSSSSCNGGFCYQNPYTYGNNPFQSPHTPCSHQFQSHNQSQSHNLNHNQNQSQNQIQNQGPIQNPLGLWIPGYQGGGNHSLMASMQANPTPHTQHLQNSQNNSQNSQHSHTPHTTHHHHHHHSHASVSQTHLDTLHTTSIQYPLCFTSPMSPPPSSSEVPAALSVAAAAAATSNGIQDIFVALAYKERQVLEARQTWEAAKEDLESFRRQLDSMLAPEPDPLMLPIRPTIISRRCTPNVGIHSLQCIPANQSTPRRFGPHVALWRIDWEVPSPAQPADLDEMLSIDDFVTEHQEDDSEAKQTQNGIALTVVKCLLGIVHCIISTLPVHQRDIAYSGRTLSWTPDYPMPMSTLFGHLS